MILTSGGMRQGGNDCLMYPTSNSELLGTDRDRFEINIWRLTGSRNNILEAGK